MSFCHIKKLCNGNCLKIITELPLSETFLSLGCNVKTFLITQQKHTTFFHNIFEVPLQQMCSLLFLHAYRLRFLCRRLATPEYRLNAAVLRSPPKEVPHEHPLENKTDHNQTPAPAPPMTMPTDDDHTEKTPPHPPTYSVRRTRQHTARKSPC